ncbi:O-antigen ligase family protein [Gabonibacter massiliensis]|uniref:O-antigen ligase family protein n=1 Tax=Gabonibacter massiliensis TaxID=1720195 RepID=UPI00073E8C6D|nr:O-antigen ligase family protein [Gabonibacter massiliensis]
MSLWNRFINFMSSQGYLYIGLLLGIIIIYKLILLKGIMMATLFACLPILLLALGWFIKNPSHSFIALYVLNYVIMGINRYVPLKSGLIMTSLTLALMVLLLLRNNYQALGFSKAKNSLTLLWSIWLIYCLFEVFNPNAMFEPWSIAFTTYALYPFVMAICIPSLFPKYHHLKLMLMLLAFLTLLASAKGYWQRNRGFDRAELYWLYVGGGASTHLIYTGVRYFSFFPDAANFGTGMGFAMIVFGISAAYVKNKWLKIYFAVAALAGGYGMLIAGTRSAMAVPFAGITCFAVLSKNYKGALTGILILIAAYCFFNFTNIGNDNGLIRRMRTAFNFNDASFQVRKKNQEQLKTYMASHPFGVGLGLGGGKAKRFKPKAFVSQIPTDSWLVMTWVETGIIGLILYMGIILTILARSAYIIMFKLKNKELKGICSALLSGIFGMVVSSYGNEVLSYPNGMIVFTAMAFIYMSKYYDEELELSGNKQLAPHEQPA